MRGGTWYRGSGLGVPAIETQHKYISKCRSSLIFTQLQGKKYGDIQYLSAQTSKTNHLKNLDDLFLCKGRLFQLEKPFFQGKQLCESNVIIFFTKGRCLPHCTPIEHSCQGPWCSFPDPGMIEPTSE